MLRTVWLGVVCLLCIGTMAAVKFSGASLASVKVSDRDQPSPTDNPITVGSTLTETDLFPPPTKSDKLAVVSADPTPIETVAMPVTMTEQKNARSQPVIKIANRHWRDPLAPKAERVSKRPKTKALKKSSIR